MTGEGDNAQKIRKWETRILKEKKRVQFWVDNLEKKIV